MNHRRLLLLLLLSSALPLAAQRNEADSLRFGKQQKRRSANHDKQPPHERRIGETRVTTAALKRVNNSALNAVAIDLEGIQSSTLDVAGALDKISGIKIRHSGGVGSETAINLNGFTGRHVRLFIDGVPMEGASSSFSLANIPAAAAQSIEVYKGVVPIELGGDALGGAVNIVTRKVKGSMLDVSYATGSYGTHQFNLLASHRWKNGFGIRLQSYLNYAANNYKVRVQNEDFATATLSPTEGWYRRFHDHYASEAVLLQLGWQQRPWADQLLLSLDYTQERADVQNANLMKIVYGAKKRSSWGLVPKLVFAKHNFLVPRLDLNLSLRHDQTQTTRIDTAAANYNWAGEMQRKTTRGEGATQHKLLIANTSAGVLGLKYRWGNHHLAFNNTLTYFTRRTDELSLAKATLTTADLMRRTNLKNVMGVEYKYVPSYHWNALLMAKHYTTHVRGPVYITPTSRRPYYEEQTRQTTAWGYGAATTYRPNNVWQFKASYERALRLPTVRELFGDGDLEGGSADLRPEQSHNLNLNLSYEPRFSKHHAMQVELGSTIRRVSDYIIRTIDTKGQAISRNFGKINAWGVDVSLQYSYKRQFEISAAYAYLSLRNAERLTDTGAASVNYGERVPNVPFSHGNFDMSYRFERIGIKGVSLTLAYGLDYIYRFYRAWVGDGAKLYIPTQFSHRASATFGMLNEQLTLALEAENFTNALLYDNYSLQKPGRALMAKLRYVFRK